MMEKLNEHILLYLVWWCLMESNWKPNRHLLFREFKVFTNVVAVPKQGHMLWEI